FLLTLFTTAVPVSAQNFTSDARLVAMGGVGGHPNDAMRFAGDTRSYRSIALPIGLFQVLKNTKVFDPSQKQDFNPLRAIQLLSSPLHYTFDLGENTPGELLVHDLVNGTLNRDLNAYRGFAPKPDFHSQGLVSPTFGKTFRVTGDNEGPHQGFYVGAGPYLAMGTNVNIDQRLVNIFTSSSNTYVRNTSFAIGNLTNGQAAGALTFGYRGRFALPGVSTLTTGRDGVYVSANYNYLRGFRYDSARTDVRFDTDSLGLVTLAPTTTPLVVDHRWSSKGNGRGIDLGTAVVVHRWEIDFAANGIANRIDWSERRAERFTLSGLSQGLAFVKTVQPSLPGDERVELPVQYLAGGAYHADRWTASSEVAHGLQDWEFRGGVEYRLAMFELRGGTLYKNEDWQPAGGAGLNITQHFGIDAAIYGTSTNIERKRKAALALSLRLAGGGDR